MFSLITRKVAYDLAAKNSAKTKSQRIDYFEFFVENNNSTFIYIDEVGYSIGAQQKWGRLQKGVK